MSWSDDNLSRMDGMPSASELRDDVGRVSSGAMDRDGEPVVRIIRNPRSHRNAKRNIADHPPPGIEVVEPVRRGDTARALAQFRAQGTDCLVIDGGDGTVRDVLTAGLEVFGDAWPVLAVLPRGKTNALAVDLDIPSEWTWRDVLDGLRAERLAMRHPLVLRQVGGDAPAMAGFLVGAGAFAGGIEAAQEAHRMGMFGQLAVGATVAWAVAQMVLGGSGNRWRRGEEMRIATLPDGELLPHRGGGDPARRSLFLATTLHRLPLGMKPWGAATDGLKLMVVDRARRGVFALAPAVMAGHAPSWLRRNGLHLLRLSEVDAVFSRRFILDGEFLEPGTWRIEQGPPLRFVVP